MSAILAERRPMCIYHRSKSMRMSATPLNAAVRGIQLACVPLFCSSLRSKNKKHYPRFLLGTCKQTMAASRPSPFPAPHVSAAAAHLCHRLSCLPLRLGTRLYTNRIRHPPTSKQSRSGYRVRGMIAMYTQNEDRRLCG